MRGGGWGGGGRGVTHLPHDGINHSRVPTGPTKKSRSKMKKRCGGTYLEALRSLSPPSRLRRYARSLPRDSATRRGLRSIFVCFALHRPVARKLCYVWCFHSPWTPGILGLSTVSSDTQRCDRRGSNQL